jgi:excisionase family DNA binding protein
VKVVTNKSPMTRTEHKEEQVFMPPKKVAGARKAGKHWKTTAEISDRYRLSIRTIAYMAADGILPYYKIGRAVRFDPSECDTAMKAFRRGYRRDNVD